MYDDYHFSGFLRKLPDGKMELHMTEGEVWGVDFNYQSGRSYNQNYTDVENDLIKLYYQQRPRNFHGLLLAFVYLEGTNGRLPLSAPLGDGTVYVNDSELENFSLYEFLRMVSTDHKNHDGAIVLDSKTGRPLGYHTRLCDLPVNGFSVPLGNGDGTRRGVAANYSKYSWVDRIYTVSENGGGIWSFETGKCREVK